MTTGKYRQVMSRTPRGMNRRQLIGGAAAAGAGAALFTPKLFNVGKAQTQTPVTFWTTFTEPDLGHLQAITDQFNAENADVLVTLVQIPPAEVTDVSKLVTAVRGGEGPDVYQMDRFIVAQYAAAGALTDLSAVAGDGVDPLEGYLPFARAEASYEEKPYAIPFDTDTRALYYNKTMLTEAGADLAEFDWANGPVTWDRVAEIATALNVKGSNGQYSASASCRGSTRVALYLRLFLGRQFLRRRRCQVTPNNEQVVAAFQWVYDYCAAQGPQELQAFAGDSKTPGFPPQENYFNTGTTAFQITGDWHLRQMVQYAPEIEYGMTYIPVPAAGDEPSTWAGGWSLVVT